MTATLSPLPPPPSEGLDPPLWGDPGNSTLMDDFQVLPNKAARIILDLPHAHLLVMLPRNYIGHHYCAEEPSTAPFLFINQLTTFFLMPFNLV